MVHRVCVDMSTMLSHLAHKALPILCTHALATSTIHAIFNAVKTLDVIFKNKSG